MDTQSTIAGPNAPVPGTVRAFAVCALTLCCATGGLAAKDPFDRLQTWSDPGANGWTNTTGQSELLNPGGLLRMGFTQQRVPQAAADTTWTPVPPGLWVTNVAFRFEAHSTPPSALRLCLHARKSLRTWYVSLALPPGTNAATFSLPIRYGAAQWISDANSRGDSYEEDLHFLDKVGVYVRRHGSAGGQDYDIDDFHVQGLIDPSDEDIDGMQDEWETAYGFSPDDLTDARRDADGDGMSNYGEFRAGTNPTNDQSWFAVDVVNTNDATGNRRIAIQWSAAPSRTYRILRATRLGNGFTPVGQTVTGTPPVNVYIDSDAESGVHFYKVKIEDD